MSTNLDTPNPDTFPDAVGAGGEGFCFHDELVALLPKLRVQALSLTRNRSEADDLVQAAVANALAAQASFTPGTRMGAWVYRIMRNRFISDRRARRETVDMDDAPAQAFARSGNQEDSIALGELRREMDRLPADQRIALVMVTVQGMSYEEVANAMRCAVGTAKCRVFRARRTLEARLLGNDSPDVSRTPRAQHAGVRRGAAPNMIEKRNRHGAAATEHNGRYG